MKIPFKIGLLLISSLLLLLAAWELQKILQPKQDVFQNPSSETTHSLVESAHEEPITPIPEALSLNPQKEALGEQLFHDPSLSDNGTISCASCHSLTKGGTDNRAFSQGIHNQIGMLNAPTVFNARFNFVQFWDGRARTLEEQVHGPFYNPVEMGNKDWGKVIQYLNDNPAYTKSFDAIYSEAISEQLVIDALAEFERSLVTPNSRFDLYLKGESRALNTQERAGYQLFKDRGCIACHQGVNMGGNMFQKAGIFKPIFDSNGDEWNGRFNVTHNPLDKGVFKVPTLRNIALTAPYFHDGSAKTLESAINIMAEHQLGIQLPASENRKIQAFLNSLTGQYKGQQL